MFHHNGEANNHRANNPRANNHRANNHRANNEADKTNQRAKQLRPFFFQFLFFFQTSGPASRSEWWTDGQTVAVPRSSRTDKKCFPHELWFCSRCKSHVAPPPPPDLLRSVQWCHVHRRSYTFFTFSFRWPGSGQKEGGEWGTPPLPRSKGKLQSAPYCASPTQEQHTFHPTPVVLVGGDTLRWGEGTITRAVFMDNSLQGAAADWMRAADWAERVATLWSSEPTGPLKSVWFDVFFTRSITACGFHFSWWLNNNQLFNFLSKTIKFCP